MSSSNNNNNKRTVTNALRERLSVVRKLGSTVDGVSTNSIDMKRECMANLQVFRKMAIVTFLSFVIVASLYLAAPEVMSMFQSPNSHEAMFVSDANYRYEGRQHGEEHAREMMHQLHGWSKLADVHREGQQDGQPVMNYMKEKAKQMFRGGKSVQRRSIEFFQNIMKKLQVALAHVFSMMDGGKGKDDVQKMAMLEQHVAELKWALMMKQNEIDSMRVIMHGTDEEGAKIFEHLQESIAMCHTENQELSAKVMSLMDECQCEHHTMRGMSSESMEVQLNDCKSALRKCSGKFDSHDVVMTGEMENFAEKFQGDDEWDNMESDMAGDQQGENDNVIMIEEEQFVADEGESEMDEDVARCNYFKLIADRCIDSMKGNRKRCMQEFEDVHKACV